MRNDDKPLAANLGIAAQGRAEYNAFREGLPLSYRKLIRATCYDCMGGFNGGKDDCGMPHCPLYPYMPYRADEKPPIHPRYMEEHRKHGKEHKGMKDYLRHLEGETLQPFRAVVAKCYACNAGYPDGWKPCAVAGCPLNGKKGAEDEE